LKNKLVKNYDSGFASLIGLLITLALMCLLVYIAFNTYFKTPVTDKETKKSLSQQGIDSSSYKTILDSSRNKVKDIQKQLKEQTEELEGLR